MPYEDIQHVLKATATGTLVHRCVLDSAVEACQDFPADEPEMSRVNTPHLCRAAILKHAGVAITYDAILVLSGQATAFGYHPRRYSFLTYSPDPADRVRDRIASAVGRRLEPLRPEEAPEGTWRILVDSLEEGKPVHGQWTDDIVFCGYEERMPRDACRVLVAGGWERLGWWNWDMFEKWAAEFGTMERVGPVCPQVTPDRLARDVIALMIRCAEADARQQVPELAQAIYGLQGIRTFVKDMGDLTKKPDYWHHGWLGGHCVYRQISGRSAAAIFLKSHLAYVTARAREHVEAATAAYSQAAHAWEKWGQCLGMESGAADVEDLRLLWMSASRRREGADWAYRALQFEMEAIRHLKLALLHMGAEE